MRTVGGRWWWESRAAGEGRRRGWGSGGCGELVLQAARYYLLLDFMCLTNFFLFFALAVLLPSYFTVHGGGCTSPHCPLATIRLLF